MTAKRSPVGAVRATVERKPEVRPRSSGPMSDGPPADGESAEDPPPDAADGDEVWVPMEGLSDDGILLLVAGVACLLAAATARTRGQPGPVVVFGAAAAVVALPPFVADLLSAYVPGLRVHLLVGAAAALAGALVLSGGHYLDAATFGAAAALVLWRVVDVEFLGAE